jgi:hypothetical protein
VSDEPGLVYLEADDEITSVVRRLRAIDASRIVVVAPGRSRATSSVVALRLLGRAAEAEGRTVVVVGDALTRSLAADAGLPAFASADEARRVDPSSVERAPAQQATIRIVRGPVDEDTIAAAAAVAAVTAVDAETRPVPVVKASPRGRGGARPVRRGTRPLTGRRGLTALGIGLAALMVLGGFAGAAFLPAATITLVPRTSPVGPASYDVAIASPERTSGTVTDSVTVEPSGTYPIEVAAAGAVVFYNFNFFPVTVPAGSLVAAGRQAFATQAEIVVPRGRITPTGQILAGQEGVAAVAAAPGPDANVEAGAIDTVLDAELDGQLQAYPENGQRRVENLEATTGGLVDTGTEFTQDDVDAAVTALNEALASGVTDALAGTEGSVVADPAAAPQAQIEGLENLVGTRDQESAELTGTLAYDRLSADPDDVRAEAVRQFEANAQALVPEGQELLPEATEVAIGAARQEGSTLVVATTVTGGAAVTVDPEAVADRVAGLAAEDAEAELHDLGDATVELWPGWVSTVPDAAWRIDVVVSGAEPTSPQPSSS